MDAMDEIKATYFVECAELLEQLEAGLLDLENGRSDAETVDAIFRAVHSIKGGAAAFELTDLVGFAHEFETVLDAVRSGALDATSDVVAVLLRASDRLGDVVAAARDGGAVDATVPEELAALALAPPSPESDPDPFGLGGADGGFTPIPVHVPIGPPADEGSRREGPRTEPRGSTDDRGRAARWQIAFEPLPDFFASGNEPLFLFRALAVLGVIRLTLDASTIPPLPELDPSKAVTRWRILLEPNAHDLTETEIESVFEFVHDLCLLEIDEVAGASDAHEDAASGPPSDDDRSNPTVPDQSVAATRIATPPPSSAVPVAVAPARPTAATIRVDLERIDRLVNLVGELVITQSMVTQTISRDGADRNPAAMACLDELQQLTREMQDSVMAIRAQPVQSLFQRMARIVREAAQATGKRVRLETEGEGTEIDKTVVERLADPLTHMIRNAVDHGLEPAETRLRAGKDAVGLVRLAARQQSDRVVIEIGDDGGGIDREKVLRRAVQAGLVQPDRQLDAHEIDRLLFAPGFSTADSVSALSGRGVGMDVVQRAIRTLNGRISIASEPGAGSTISISLPLTLAILDGMIVRSAGQRMIIPLSAIQETQTVESARIDEIADGRTLVLLHDRFVPMLDLGEAMGFAGRTGQECPEDSSFLFLRSDDGPLYALRVDAIESQRQVVVKGLGDSVGRIRSVSAATILGDGQVALIIDPAGLAAEAIEIRSQPRMWNAA